MKTIIVYTSRYGCAEKAAYLLKSRLGGETEVVHLQAGSEPSLAAYDTVILGGSIYYGKIQKEMAAYAERIQSQLGGKSVGLFICAGMKGEQAAQELAAAFPRELYASAVAKEVMGDEVYPNKLSRLDRLVLKVVRGKKQAESGLSPEAIERFAQAVTNGGFNG